MRRGLAMLAVMVALAGPSAASACDVHVRSFDGTNLVVHFFPAAGLPAGQRAPTVLMGPGWSQPGDTHPEDKTLPGLGAVGVGTLRHAGYNVLTWDPRGFGASGGLVESDSPKFEGRDVSALIDYAARQPEALLDRRRDPRVGMAGASYGGGIQLVAAARDHRIDAIVPDIAWHSLLTSLGKNATVKSSWGFALYGFATAVNARLDPALTTIDQQAVQSPVPSRLATGFFSSRGPGSLVARIRAPTLLIQGTVDTLFTLREADENYRILHAKHVPVKMLWFCGGHGICLTDPGDTSRIQRDTLAWLGRYLKRRRSVHTGAAFEWLDQNGRSYHASRYPLRRRATLVGFGSGSLSLVGAGGAGPVSVPPGALGALGPLGGMFASGKATNAVNVGIPHPPRTVPVVGAPRLWFSYAGTAPSANARVLAQIVDNSTGKVLGNQVTPIPVRLDGKRHRVAIPLEMIAATASRRSRFSLQLVAQSAVYDVRPKGGSVRFSKVRIALPAVRT